jgi:hypothetical protein
MTLLFSCQNDKDLNLPKPVKTIVKMDMEDGSTKDIKKAWLEMIHKAPEGVDWEKVEFKNYLERIKSIDHNVKAGEEIIVDGHLIGEWKERGSNNQAGSVHAPQYNKYTDELFLISDGGILWKSDQDGNNWTAQNDFFRLDQKFLAAFHDGTSTRLVASVYGKPYYSDDHGISWIASNTDIGNGDGWSRTNQWVQLKESGHIFILNKSGYWGDLSLYQSLDQGESFDLVRHFNTNNLNNFGLCNPNGTDDFYLIEQLSAFDSKIFKWDHTSNQLEELHQSIPYSFKEGTGNLSGFNDGDKNLLYSYDQDLNFLVSANEGMSWDTVSQLPEKPWTRNIFISDHNPNLMIFGAVNASRSMNAGADWEFINEWWEYYDQVETMMHADIMFIEEFERMDGPPMILISNHGGISKTINDTYLNLNIGMTGLNVGQFYDVKSNPLDQNFIFGGTQDQGFQRGYLSGDAPIDLDQVISGDYGHIEFTGFGAQMWMVYPGGWVSYYNEPLGGGITKSWTLESENESVWIPPLQASPYSGEDAVYMAGGNADGGPGSYLLKLSSVPGQDEILVDQFDFDFLADSDGEISAIAFNHFNPDIIYILTTSGAFYRSDDSGLSFSRKNINAPGAHYLYGACIYPSKLDPTKITISGSGYGNSAVFRSNDNGESFYALDAGLPSTLVFSVDANDDESLLFGASEAGPLVYVEDLATWYHMGGSSAPSQTYWSVEYIAQTNSVRYGTYGRGIWDFDISEIASSIEETASIFNANVYPNPATNMIKINSEESQLKYEIFNEAGQIIKTGDIQNQQEIEISEFSNGRYWIKLESNHKIKTISFSKI